MTDLANHKRQEIWELYWQSDIPPAEIAEAYGIPHPSGVFLAAGPAYYVGYVCSDCSLNIEVKSRSDTQRRLRCDKCERLENRRQRQAWIAIEKEAEARARLLQTMPYREYLATPEWKDIRLDAIKRAKFRCQTCCSDGLLNVHHRTYVRRGREHFSDLTVLCRSCHEVFHEKRRLAENGRSATI